jgi:hypothetical protein
MRKLHIIIIVVVAALACSATVATSAFALESVFLVSGVKPTAETTIKSESSGVVLIEDMGTLASMVNCEGVTNEEQIQAGGKIVIVLKVTFTKACTAPEKAQKLKGTEEANACTSVDTSGITLIDLPWKAEVVLSGATFLMTLVSDGNGEPGYKLECETALGLVTDECKTEKNTATLTNSGEDVSATFPTAPEESEFANCSIGGKLQGLVTGNILFFTGTAGLALAVSEG